MWQPSRGIPGNIGTDHVGFTVPDAEFATNFLIELFDCELDWEIRRKATPTSGEKGWDKLFDVHPDSYMPHVTMVKCGDHHLAQYVEFFEWNAPNQQHPKPWTRFSDIGHGYLAFTVKDIAATMAFLKETTYFKNGEIRFLQDPPMAFPLRHEMCTSTFLVSPWGQWIELSEWSQSGAQASVMQKSLDAAEGSCDGETAEKEVVRQNIADLVTPQWYVDLDVVEENIAVFKKRLGDVAWRPPVKAHKSPKFAQYLQSQGAQGIITLKVSEAEVFAANGVRDIYIANIIVQEEMIQRMVRLSGRIDRVIVHVDNEDNVRQIARVAEQAGLTLDVLVELNIGHNRTGVDSIEHALELVTLLQDIEHGSGALSFVGIAGYEGHTPVLKPEQKTIETIRCHNILKATRDAIQEKFSLKDMIVSGGGSSNYVDALEAGIINEVQAGGVAVVDKLYAKAAGLEGHGHKIGSFLTTTVVSVSRDGLRAMSDAGFKAVGWHPFAGLPIIVDNEDWEVAGLSAEHLKLKPVDPENPKPLAVGTRLTLVPGYTDAMGLNHKQFYGVRNGEIHETFEVLAHGMLQ